MSKTFWLSGRMPLFLKFVAYHVVDCVSFLCQFYQPLKENISVTIVVLGFGVEKFTQSAVNYRKK